MLSIAMKLCRLAMLVLFSLDKAKPFSTNNGLHGKFVENKNAFLHFRIAFRLNQRIKIKPIILCVLNKKGSLHFYFTFFLRKIIDFAIKHVLKLIIDLEILLINNLNQLKSHVRYDQRKWSRAINE